jgi:hypothetical protein
MGTKLLHRRTIQIEMAFDDQKGLALAIEEAKKGMFIW